MRKIQLICKERNTGYRTKIEWISKKCTKDKERKIHRIRKDRQRKEKKETRDNEKR